MSRAARLARGWAIGSVATLVAAVSHAVAGGAAPSPLAISLGVVFAGFVGTTLIGRRAGLLRMSLIVAISQAAFHLGFSLLSTGAVSVVSSGAHHHVVTVPTVGTTMTHAHADGSMWIAHAVAAALTILYLRRIERSVWAVLRSACRSLLRRVTVILDARPTALARPTRVFGVRALLCARLADAIARRGPPALLSF